VTDVLSPEERAARAGCRHLATETERFVNDLHPIVDEARAACGVAWDDTAGRWFVESWAAAITVLKDWETFTSTRGASGLDGAPLMPPIDTDPPVHDDWRTTLNPFFTPAAVRVWEPATRRIAQSLIEDFRDDGTVEFVSQFARPFPGRVFFGEVMQLPLDDVEQCQHWAEMIVGLSDDGDQLDGYAGLGRYVGELVAARRDVEPSGTVVDAVVHAQIGGEPVSVADATTTVMMLILGGLETTTNTLGSSMWHLARHSDHQARIRADTALVPAAVEELLRVYAPTIGLCRAATVDTTVDSVPVLAGEQVMVSYLSANHDPATFEDPHAFRLDRPNSRHLAFGYGLHFCLGAHLARQLVNVAISELLGSLDDISVAPGSTPRYLPSNVHTLGRLDLVFRPRPD
jgi:cytochrome P450